MHGHGPARQADRVSPVNSHNEWDPLEEVIVGRLEGAVIPSDHPVVTCNIPGIAARPSRCSQASITQR
jgi:glycine amidinotransferase